jgi:lipoprotein-releasing system permease protein
LEQGVDPNSMIDAIQTHWHGFAVEHMNYAPDVVPHLSIHMSEDWHRDVFEDLRNQLRVVLLIFGVICSVAVLLIFCIFYMIVTARQKDIAIIKSCGASGRAAASIFVGFGTCVAIIGSAFGILLAVLITKNINTLEEWVRLIFGIKLWRTSSYGLATIPHQLHWPAVPWIIAVAVIGCIIGVLIPAVIAARTNPVKILRYE